MIKCSMNSKSFELNVVFYIYPFVYINVNGYKCLAWEFCEAVL